MIQLKIIYISLKYNSGYSGTVDERFKQFRPNKKKRKLKLFLLGIFCLFRRDLCDSIYKEEKFEELSN